MSMNQHARKSRLRDRISKRERLMGAAPELFNINAPRLLHSSVAADLSELTGIGRGTVNQFLKWWTSKLEYLRVMADPSSVYYSLDGQTHGFATMGTVTQATHKITQLVTAQVLADERKKARGQKATRSGRSSASAISTSNRPRTGQGGAHRKREDTKGQAVAPKIRYKRTRSTKKD